MTSGSYELKIACDFYHCRRIGLPIRLARCASFQAPRRSDCVRLARKAGWHVENVAITRVGGAIAYCPLHATKKARSAIERTRKIKNGV